MRKFDIIIDGIKIDPNVFTTRFGCNYKVCHGKCCWGNNGVDKFDGAPISKEEAELLNENRIKLSAEINNPDCRKKAEEGITYNTADGENAITLTDSGVCIFSDERGCIVKRVLGNIPISCELYPLGIYWNGETDVLRYDDTEDNVFCKCIDNPPFLIDFPQVKHGLIRAFGQKFYTKLKQVQNEYLIGQYNLLSNHGGNKPQV